MKRVLLALIPVALLASASLALPDLTPEPIEIATSPNDEAMQVAAAPAATAAVKTKTYVAQSKTSVQTRQVAQESTEQAQEQPLPEFVVDTTPLIQALADLDNAIEQAKLAVTALDPDAQQRYIQETVNLLGGSNDANFRLVGHSGSAEAYKGAAPLLVQALVNRQAAEVQWIAAVERQQRQVELAQAGSSGAPPAAPSSTLVASVLGTGGMRPEEQANQLVTRALKAALEALRMASTQESVRDEIAVINHVSDEAAAEMERIVRILESARKIVQIAISR